MAHIDQMSDTATERLWREHSSDLVGLATMLVGPADAHDIAVAAFMRAAPAADQPALSNARAFLMRSVVNRAHDLRRSNERRWRRDLAAVGPASTDDPDSFIDVRRAVSTSSVEAVREPTPHSRRRAGGAGVCGGGREAGLRLGFRPAVPAWPATASVSRSDGSRSRAGQTRAASRASGRLLAGTDASRSDCVRTRPPGSAAPCPDRSRVRPHRP